MDVERLIQEYENLFYLITFGWAFIEGESFVIFAGAASFKGHLNIYLLILAAWLGSFCGDQLWFLLGRKFGKRLMNRFPKLEGGFHVAMSMVEKYDVLFILSFRFIYGVRNVASPAMGMSNYSWPRFAIFNFIAAFLWANSFAWGGFFLAKAFESVLGDISKNFGFVMLAVFGLVVSLLVFIHWRGKKRYKKMLAEQDAEEAREAAEAATVASASGKPGNASSDPTLPDKS